MRNDYKPIVKNIKCINDFYNQGHIIKIFTARYMGRNNDNIQKAKKAGLLFTKKQLLDWNLKYHKLIMGKPSFDIYIDDKNLEYKKDWANSLKNKLKIRII